MKKKVLVTLMAVFMMVGMTVGCGKNTTPMHSSEPSSAAPASAEYVPEIFQSSPEAEDSSVAEEISEADDWQEELGHSSSPAAVSEDEDALASSPEAEESTEERTPSEPGIQNPEGISGLIIRTTSRNAQSGTCNVTSFNPESGKTKSISSFKFNNSNEFSYFWADSESGGYKQFDYTYTRMATRQLINATGEEHAGWLTADGKFFDVTEAIGWARQGDFDDPVLASSIGFTDNDLFIFSVTDYNHRTNVSYYSVPISDISESSVQECRVSAYSGYAVESYMDYLENLVWKYGEPTGWIDDTHCVVNPDRNFPEKPTRSVILDIGSGSLTDYIPGDSRENWDGRVSPNKTQIAFVSMPKSGNEPPDIFIVSVDGGNPERVAAHDFTLTDIHSGVGLGLMAHDNYCVLIDWR